MALGIAKYFYGRPSQPSGVRWFAVSLIAVSCRGPQNLAPNWHRKRKTALARRKSFKLFGSPHVQLYNFFLALFFSLGVIVGD